uniref:Uncharacterized protein n=1 Tax=Leersia perrieri TaxID=77586 RepID=A0A0D9WNB9_9ORYZ
MAAVGKPKEADAARCRKHPKHRHSAGVCPFCLRDRLSRLSAEAASSPSPPSSSSSASSSPCSSSTTTGEGRAQAQPPPCRRARLGTLMQQEQRETTTTTIALAAGRDKEDEKKTKATATVTRRNGFWARLQQQLQHGCSLAHSKAVGEKTAAAAPAKRPPALV